MNNSGNTQGFTRTTLFYNQIYLEKPFEIHNMNTRAARRTENSSRSSLSHRSSSNDKTERNFDFQPFNKLRKISGSASAPKILYTRRNAENTSDNNEARVLRGEDSPVHSGFPQVFL